MHHACTPPGWMPWMDPSIPHYAPAGDPLEEEVVLDGQVHHLVNLPALGPQHLIQLLRLVVACVVLVLFGLVWFACVSV